MNKLLTVAIPSYNVENYIDQCLSSLVCPELMEELEVLIINDGSSDHTAEKAQAFVEKYPETFRLINKENGGHGSGINRGIKEATGTYFKVLDSDDWFLTENLPALFDALRNSNADLITSDFRMIEDETENVLGDRQAAKKEEHYCKTWDFDDVADENLALLHSATFKTEILQKHDIQVDEHTFYEDIEYDLYPIPYVETVYFDPHVIYMYRMGRAGQSVDVQSMVKRRTQHAGVIQSLYQFYDTNKHLSKEKRSYLDRGLIFIIENQFQIYLAMNSKEAKEEMISFDGHLKKNYPDVYAAVEKKSIWAMRWSNYAIYGLGAWVYKILRG